LVEKEKINKWGKHIKEFCKTKMKRRAKLTQVSKNKKNQSIKLIIHKQKTNTHNSFLQGRKKRSNLPK
jgi:hypothetical protein